jgi:hypothetical protein
MIHNQTLLFLVFIIILLASSCNNPNSTISSINIKSNDSLLTSQKPFFLNFQYGNTFKEFYDNLEKSKKTNPSMFDEKDRLILASKRFKNSFKIEPFYGSSNLQYIDLIMEKLRTVDLTFNESLLEVDEKQVYIYSGGNQAIEIGGQVAPIPEIVSVKDNLAQYTRTYAANRLVQSSESGSQYKTYVSKYYTRDINSSSIPYLFLSRTDDYGFHYIENGDSVILELIDLYKEKYGPYITELVNSNFLYCLKYILTDSEYAKSNSLGGNRFKPQQGIVDEIEYSLPCRSTTFKLKWTVNDIIIELLFSKWFLNNKIRIEEKGPFITSCSIKYIPKKYFEELDKEKTKDEINKDSINQTKVQKTKEMI